MALVQLPTDRLLTPGLLAELTGHTRDRVCYVVRHLGLQPKVRAGHVRVFDAKAADQIVRALDRIEVVKATVSVDGVQSAEVDLREH